ncbi:MAG TPA: hypothetical protein VJR89_17000 [Polyangiales bacterium]|nr:hypothetical protein [Polyangiales bacterium]
MTSSTEQLPSALEPAGEALATPWQRDPRLWTAVFVTLLAKLAVIGLWLHVWNGRDWLEHVNVDLWTWHDFFAASRAGGIPYVDFGREYPVLAGGLYWLLARTVDVESKPALILTHAALMACADLINAGLFYVIARELNARLALPAALIFSLSLTGLLLGPMRFDGLLVTSLLAGYRLHQLGRPLAATVAWSLGCAIKWFPAFLIAIQETRAFCAGERGRRWLRAGAWFAGIQLALNGPFLLGGLLAHGNIDNWLYTYTYHAERKLSADTVLGVGELWFGRLAFETYATYWSLALMLAAIVLRPLQPLAYKVVLVGIAAVLLNRIYSPQFNLWFYPFLLLIILEARPRRALWLIGLFALLDVLNVRVYPFDFTSALNEIGKFRPYRGAWKGGEATKLFSICVMLRFAVLLVLGAELWRGPAPAPLSLPRIRSALARSLPGAATACGLAAYGLWARVATLNMPRYSDEKFHIRQIHRLCRGQDELLGTLTMLPGYHAITAGFGKLIESCAPHVLRTFSLGWGLAASLVALLILGTLGSQRSRTRTIAFYFLPILLPYYVLVYTDVAAFVPALLAVYFVTQRRWTAAGIASSTGILFRQSNAVVLLFIVGVALLEHDRRGRARDWMVRYLKQTWAAWLGLAGFGAFVIVNGGVALGDRSRHTLGVHFENVWFALALLCLTQLPVLLENLWSERARLRAWKTVLVLGAAYSLYMLTFRVEHEFNGHLDFLRNQFLHWVVESPWRKTLFFVPVALGLGAVCATRFSRPSYWLLLPVALLTLMPEGLVEQRYAILPIGLWLVLRRDASRSAEAATALLNAALATALVLVIASGRQL